MRAWVVRSSADTGSSQTISSRFQRERPCDRDPLALSAAEFARQAVGGVRGQVDQVEQVAHPAGGILRPTPRARSGSVRVSPTVSDGLSEE